MPIGIYNHKPLSEESKRNLSLFWKGKKKSKEHSLNIKIAKQGSKNPAYGIAKTEEQKKRISNTLKGRIPWNKGKKCPQLATNWQGGISTVNELQRHSLEYRLWRTAVFKRDNYTCQNCHIRGGTLNADHIKPFAFYYELRFAIDNGRTLCESCHKKTDTYGKNNRRRSS